MKTFRDCLNEVAKHRDRKDWEELSTYLCSINNISAINNHIESAERIYSTQLLNIRKAVIMAVKLTDKEWLETINLFMDSDGALWNALQRVRFMEQNLK